MRSRVYLGCDELTRKAKKRRRVGRDDGSKTKNIGRATGKQMRKHKRTMSSILITYLSKVSQISVPHPVFSVSFSLSYCDESSHLLGVFLQKV
jgi:hypothetical protein